MKALIIDEPWISLILRGEKIWEMRATTTSHRGWFGLVRKGSGTVCGVARLTECLPPLSQEGMIGNMEKHRIPAHLIRSGSVQKWTTPWVLADVRPLASPVPYQHKSGAVIWVQLDEAVSEAVLKQAGGIPEAKLSAIAPSNKPKLIAPAKVTGKADGIPMTEDTASLVGQTELTDANIKNNHIYLRGFFHKFPSDAIGGSNRSEAGKRTIRVEWGTRPPIETDLDGVKMFFRSRALARQFFEDTGAEAGDRVQVLEVAPYRYELRLVKPAPR